jgi:hypothetical protein
MRAVVLLASLAIGAMAPLLHAMTPRDQARSLAHDGMRLLDAGRHTEALSHFRHARSLVHAPTLAVLEARTLEELGRLKEARDLYRQVVERAEVPGEPHAFALAHRQSAQHLKDLDKKLPRLVFEVEEATRLDVVSVDGEAVALVGGRGEVRLDPGRHVVTHQRGKERVARVVHLLAYQEKVLVFESESPGATQRTLGWIGVGVGAAGVVTGVTAGMVAANADRELEKDCVSGSCPPASHDALDRFRTARTVSTMGYVAGLVGAGLGVALLTTAPSGPDRIAKRQPALSLSAGWRVAYLSGQF